ncbi:DUF2207 domain-containing protein [Marinilactibacillus sp. GCM10026970]|uniref:DUF2207 domain-containing protein n=1 Tax=Marinilactibacillus sp. GCM10026970 TaxID=3252642 RepID=UPI00361455D4
MRKLVGCFIGLVGFGVVVGGQTVHAAEEENTMPSMEIEVELQEDGSGIITEHRKMNMVEGTELFINMENLNDSEVKDFYVEGYTYNPDWDFDNSREEKAGTYGMSTENGLELIWGIGEYGLNDYELTYTVTDLVRQLDDGQALNWDFNTFGDIPPEAVSITIDGPIEFNQENTLIWGFGYDGIVELDNGQLVSSARTGLDSNDSLVILMQFPESPFAAGLSLDQTLEEQLERSQDGATYNEAESMSTGAIIALISFVVGIPVALAGLFINLESRKKQAGKMVTGYARRVQNKNETYGDIPYQDGDIFDVAYFLNELQQGTFEDYFFAYLLKWSKEEKIRIHTQEKEGWINKEKTVIELIEQHSEGMAPFERRVWGILESASDLSGKITEDDMKYWAKKNAKQLGSLASDIKEESKEILIKKGYLETDSIRFMGMESSFIKASREGDQLFDRITQFGNHLDDLESDDSLAYRQTLPWVDFIIWATLYGKGSDIVESLEELYPEQFQEWVAHYPVFYGGYHRMYGFSNSMSSGMQSGGYNAAGGAGGSTSIGGGGGAMGGGGGGAR